MHASTCHQLCLHTHMLRVLLPPHVTPQGSAAARINTSSSSSPPCVLGRSFTHAAHQGPVRCLDAGGPWLVSGGQDDQLHIYDGKVCLCAVCLIGYTGLLQQAAQGTPEWD